jgi:hypothetical protein
LTLFLHLTNARLLLNREDTEEIQELRQRVFDINTNVSNCNLQHNKTGTYKYTAARKYQATFMSLGLYRNSTVHVTVWVSVRDGDAIEFERVADRARCDISQLRYPFRISQLLRSISQAVQRKRC